MGFADGLTHWRKIISRGAISPFITAIFWLPSRSCSAGDGPTICCNQRRLTTLERTACGCLQFSLA
jgi:hypothetical protein